MNQKLIIGIVVLVVLGGVGIYSSSIATKDSAMLEKEKIMTDEKSLTKTDTMEKSSGDAFEVQQLLV